jgi:hypothetical protein
MNYNEKVLENIFEMASDQAYLLKPFSNRLGTDVLSKNCRQGQIKLPANTNLKRK